MNLKFTVDMFISDKREELEKEKLIHSVAGKGLTKRQLAVILCFVRLRSWRNRHTRTFEGRVLKGVRVQVPSTAPTAKPCNRNDCRLFYFSKYTQKYTFGSKNTKKPPLSERLAINRHSERYTDNIS